MTSREGEYHYIKSDQLVQFQREGWILVGRVVRVGYVGPNDDSLIVRRPTSKLPLPDPPLEITR